MGQNQLHETRLKSLNTHHKPHETQNTQHTYVYKTGWTGRVLQLGLTAVPAAHDKQQGHQEGKQIGPFSIAHMYGCVQAGAGCCCS